MNTIMRLVASWPFDGHETRSRLRDNTTTQSTRFNRKSVTQGPVVQYDISTTAQGSSHYFCRYKDSKFSRKETNQ